MFFTAEYANSQLFALNRITDVSLICARVFYRLKLTLRSEIGLSAPYGFSLSVRPAVPLSVTVVVRARTVQHIEMFFARTMQQCQMSALSAEAELAFLF